MAEAQASMIQAQGAPPKTQPKTKAYVSPGVSLIAGGVAGGVEAMCTYPFEFAKTRMQLRDTPSISAAGTGPSATKITRNPLILIRDIVRTEGLSALYTGCTTLVVGTAFKASVRFLTFDSIKNALADEKGHLSKGSGILAGMMAGCVESVVAVTPTERIKTALIDDAKGPKRFRNTTHGIRLLIREQGLRSIYQGLIPTTMKQSATSAVRMGSYNMLKESAKHYHIPLNGVTTFGIGSVAGIITVYATQPFDTIKTRVQGTQKATIREAVGDVLREAGYEDFGFGVE
ncbi:hypothetical protein ZTR_00967 [Talaromyces verruculosus]|nr:hypothetical protein ZTR_00967 [Talaromyces verruculosus]